MIRGVAGEVRRPMSPLARLAKGALLTGFDQAGWDVEGNLPLPPKVVVMGAPHTSNWDFIVFMSAMEKLGLEAHFIGKHSLFRWPIDDFMRGMGGIPVDRTSRNDLTEQVAARIRAAERFALVIAPEGTRQPTTEWRSGFYRIAMAAGVPIQCAGPDYQRRRGVFGPVIHPTGDFAADMAPAWTFFRTLRPRHPERVLFPNGFGMDAPPAGT
jgi:1-acyl-sn-glycerol-3-phosphate acyltransferase